VIILAELNLPSQLAADTSALYARNLLNFVELLVDKDEKKITVDWEDEIIVGTCLTRDGKIVHPGLQPKDETPPAPEPTADADGDDVAGDDETSSETGA
jgi:NAD(P) transhydrogenase subunit alpha